MLTRTQAATVLQIGADMPTAIQEREREIRSAVDDIGIDYARDRVQKTATTHAIEAIVAQLRNDRVREELEIIHTEYLRIMAQLTPKQRTFVYWRYRRRLPLASVAMKMGVSVKCAEWHAARLFRTIEKICNAEN